MQKIITHLWFDSEAEEAANFYTSVFKDSRITHIARYPTAGTEVTGKEPGSVMTVAFELNGQSFVALNGGPIFKFNEAISLLVNCDTQEEVDYYWEKLSAYPESEQCGWLKDKYGLSWQIVPAGMEKMFSGGDQEKIDRAMKAMLGMKKLNLAALEAAYEGT